MNRSVDSLIVWIVFDLLCAPLAGQNWPRFRGPDGAGIADASNIPTSWDLQSGKNVLWTHDIEGTGHSSPIVWEHRVFLTTAAGPGEVELQLGKSGGIDLALDSELEWKIICLDKNTGKLLWERSPYQGEPRAQRHVKASQANATPVTDGRYVVAIFGSEGLVSYDLEGNELWRKDLGTLDPGLWKDPSSQWGHASSPVIYRDRVIVQVDRHRDSYLAAYRLSDGSEFWRVERDELPVWSTPLVVHHGNRAEVIVNGGNYIRSYDPESGEELWRFKDFAEVKTPSPILANGKLIVTGGYPGGRPIFSFKTGLSGDVSLAEGEQENEALYWNTGRYSGYTPTPILYRGILYSLDDNGVVALLDGETGELIRQQRLDGSYSASPIASDGVLYFCSEGGEVSVRKAGSLDEVFRSDLAAPCMATPAVSGDILLIRSQDKLYAISER